MASTQSRPPFYSTNFFWSSEGPRQRTTRTESHLGPVSRKPVFRARKAMAKPRTSRLQSCFIYVFLFWRDVPFIQEVSGVYTSPFLDTDNLKMALRARKVSRNGPLVWKSCTPHAQPTLCRRNMKSFILKTHQMFSAKMRRRDLQT